MPCLREELNRPNYRVRRTRGFKCAFPSCRPFLGTNRRGKLEKRLLLFPGPLRVPAARSAAREEAALPRVTAEPRE